MKLLQGMFGAALGLMVSTIPVYAENTVKLSASEQSTLATIATIDIAEILVSEVALNKKGSSDVTDLAQMMVNQHGNNLTQILSMVGDSAAKLPLGQGEAEKLAANGKKDIMALGALQGNQFDKAYANAMVSGHEAALKLIDTQLMKTAQSAEMKTFMSDTRAAVVDHLEHAKKVQKALES